jgi:hypothetical protein
MAEWVVCPTCNLKHSARPDRLCPRCRESVDRASSVPVSVSVPVSEPVSEPVPEARPASTESRCQSCGALGPTGPVEYHQNIGLIVMRLHRSLKGSVCPKCSSKHFWQMTLATLVGGWWGIISFFVTPFILLTNVIQFLAYKPGAAVRTAGVAAGGTGPASPSRGLAIASLLIGVVGLFTVGLFGVGAVLGLILGIVAYARASRSPDAYAGRGIAVVGIALNALAGLFAAFAVFAVLVGSRNASRPHKPGEAGFDQASAKIVAFEGEAAFGNTDEAKSLAQRYSRIMEAMAAIAFTRSGSKDAPSLTQGKFLTYCELHADRICFLVHVPELRNYHADVRDSLLRIAWLSAKQVTSDLRKEKDRRLAVALRGALFYGGIAIGMGETAPQQRTAETVDTSPLYDFFTEPAAAPPIPSAGATLAGTATPVEQGPPHLGVVDLVPGKAVAFDVGEGYLATCADFRSPSGTYQVSPDGAAFPVRLMGLLPPSGIALVQVPAVSRLLSRAPKTEPLRLASSEGLQPGQEVRLQGPAQEGRAPILRGAFRGRTREGSVSYLDVGMQAPASLTGAPLLDAAGQVVGMAARRPGETSPRFVGVEQVRALLASFTQRR